MGQRASAAPLLLLACATIVISATAGPWSPSANPKPTQQEKQNDEGSSHESSRDSAAIKDVQALLENHSKMMSAELEMRLEELLQRQRDVLLRSPVVAGGRFEPDYYTKRSRRLAFTAGVLTAALLCALFWWGWYQHKARHAAIQQEAAAVNVLARGDPADMRQLIAEVSRQRALPAWLDFPDFQRVEWMNAIVDDLWPHAAAAVVQQVKEQLEPQIKAAKPKWIGDISLAEFELGEAPPRLKGIKVYPKDAAGGDDVIVDADAVWASNCAVTLKMKLLPERIPLLPKSVNVTAFVTKLLSRLIFIKMGVTSVSFSGRLRLTMSALTDRLPVVQAVQVSLVELPRFSFGVVLYEYLNLMALPGLESFVHYFIRDILLRPYVLPEAVTIPLTPGAAGRKPPPKGLLFVRVVEATNIPNLDWRSLLSKPDCCVELSVRARVKKRTQVVWNSKCPKWEEDFRFLVHIPDHQELVAVLKDHDRVLGDSEVGRVAIPIRSVPPNSEQDLWVEVKPAHKGFGSLGALKNAMHTMRGHQGPARVSQVDDPGSTGANGNVEPCVEEVTPPDEVSPEDDESVLATPRRDEEGRRPTTVAQGGGPETDHEIEHIQELATEPGHCRALQEHSTADVAEAQQSSEQHGSSSSGSTALVPAHEGDSHEGAESPIAPSSPVSSQQGRGEAGSSRVQEVGGSEALPRRRSLDQDIAAARRRRRPGDGKEPCKLHFVLAYVEIGSLTVAKAKESSRRTSELAGADEQERKILSALRSGVLEVKLAHTQTHEGVFPARQVRVRVGDRVKMSAAAKGSRVNEASDTDEVLDFVVEGDLVDDPSAQVELEVWDAHWAEDDTPLWEWESRGAMPLEPARISLPLHDITTAKRLHKAWRVGAGGKVVLLDAEFVWLAVMDQGGS